MYTQFTALKIPKSNQHPPNTHSHTPIPSDRGNNLGIKTDTKTCIEDLHNWRYFINICLPIQAENIFLQLKAKYKSDLLQNRISKVAQGLLSVCLNNIYLIYFIALHFIHKTEHATSNLSNSVPYI